MVRTTQLLANLAVTLGILALCVGWVIVCNLMLKEAVWALVAVIVGPITLALAVTITLDLRARQGGEK